MLYFAIFFAALCLVEAVPDKSKWELFVCRENGVMTPNDARMAEVGACGKHKCNYVCQARALGLVNEDGTTSLAIYREWVDAIFRPEHKAVANKLFAACYRKFGRHIDPRDPECAMSKAYGECTWGLVPALKCNPVPARYVF